MIDKVINQMIEGDPKENRKKIMAAVLKSVVQEKSGGNNLEYSPEEEEAASELVDCILQEAENYACKLTGKVTQLRYHPVIMNIATNMYLSSPSAYVDLQKNTVYAMPTESTMKKHKHKQKAKDGKYVRIILLHAFTHQQRAKEPDRTTTGHLSCDEMKLRPGIWYNTKTHEIMGFSDNVYSLDTIVHSYLEDPQGIGNNLTTYVNQWVYRSSCGMIFPCEFYYNSSSMTGQTIYNQWERQVFLCESIGRLVLGTSMDAGGANASFFRSCSYWRFMRKTDGWLDADYYEVAHPRDPDRVIIIYT